MTFVSNARRPLPAEAGTVFTLKAEPSVKIHQYIGCGETWFLSCHELGLDTESLGTEYFEDAVANAQKMIGDRIAQLTARFLPLVADKTEIVRTRG